MKRKINPLSIAILLGSVVISCVGAIASAAASEAKPPVRETLAQRDERMAWWREARFGMFVHWGLYSGLAGTWEGEPVRVPGGMEWIQQKVGVDTETYAKAAIPLFKPKPDFAREWAELAKEAGCRYVVFTTKHHDGFSLHDSDVGTFHAGAVLERDLVREIVDALRAESLRIGFYHSVIDWHHDQYEYNLSERLPHPLRGQPYPNGERDHTLYQDYLHTQAEELASRYGPVDIFWWDYSAVDFQGDKAWRALELIDRVRIHQPRVLMNNRLFRIPEAGYEVAGSPSMHTRPDPRYADFTTPEQHIPDTGVPGVDWETCMTMNTTWGYSEHDHDWKSSETLIRNLIDIVSKGGNYLLNVGPKADGTIPEASVKRMRAIGEWMSVNSESIYGTTASPFTDLPWGRATSKGNTLYLHVFDWPDDARLHVPLKAEIESATLLAQPGEQLETKVFDLHTEILLPAEAPDPIATTIRIDLGESPSAPADEADS